MHGKSSDVCVCVCVPIIVVAMIGISIDTMYVCVLYRKKRNFISFIRKRILLLLNHTGTKEEKDHHTTYLHIQKIIRLIQGNNLLPSLQFS